MKPMTDKLKPVKCGCGGEAVHETSKGYNPFKEEYVELWHRVICKECKVQTGAYYTEAEAVKTWNRAMSGVAKNVTSERTAKVIEHDASVTDTDGYKYQRSEYLCENCKKRVIGGDDYCSHCGCRLDWNEDIPMEYFESGGK